jgi:thiamine transporter
MDNAIVGTLLKMNKRNSVKTLAESAVCVAAAAVLSMFTFFSMPLGGSVTPFATLPVIIIGLRHGMKWGIASALVFSLTQLLLGMSNVAAVPVRSLWNMLLCAVLDYILAYTFLGLTGSIARLFRARWVGIPVGVIITGLGRLACSFLSGIVIWGAYAPEGWSVALYSLAYNATWCLPDVGITLAACLLLARVRALDILPAKARQFGK